MNNNIHSLETDFSPIDASSFIELLILQPKSYM